MSTTGQTSNAFRNMIINHTLRSASISGSVCYLALYRSSPTENDVGEEVPLIYGYEREDVYQKWNFSSTTGSASLSTGITFGYSTGSWGYITHWGIRNGSQAGGNSGSLLFWGAIGPPLISASSGRYIGEGDRMNFASDSIGIDLEGDICSPLSGSILKHYLYGTRLSASSIPAWLGLYTFPFTDSGNYDTSGSLELSGSIGYQRIPVWGSGSWSNPISESASGITYNKTNFVFSTNLPLTWYGVGGAFIVSSASGGYMMYRAPLSLDEGDASPVGLNRTSPPSDYINIEQGSGFMFSASSFVMTIT